MTTQDRRCCPQAHDLVKAYLLGGVSAEVRAEAVTHLDGCAVCAEECEELAYLVALLREFRAHRHDSPVL